MNQRTAYLQHAISYGFVICIPSPNLRTLRRDCSCGGEELSWGAFGRMWRAKVRCLRLIQKFKRNGSALSNISFAHCEKRATVPSETTALHRRCGATIDAA